MENVGSPPRVVYFIQADASRMLKIGVATNVMRRLAALQTGSPEPLTVRAAVTSYRAAALEKELHGRFAEERQHGEWFAPSERLLDYINENAFGWSRRMPDGRLSYPMERAASPLPRRR